jgi:hypothetical protein
MTILRKNNIANIIITGNAGAINLVHFANMKALGKKTTIKANRSKLYSFFFQLIPKNPKTPNRNTGQPKAYGKIFFM